MILGFGASALRTKIDQQMVEKRNQHRSGFWIDVWSILARFGEGFGRQNRPNIDPKNNRKHDLEQKGRDDQNIDFGPPTPKDGPHLGRWGGSTLIERQTQPSLFHVTCGSGSDAFFRTSKDNPEKTSNSCQNVTNNDMKTTQDNQDHQRQTKTNKDKPRQPTKTR